MEQRQFFAGMHQKGRQLLGVGAIVAELNQSDRPIAATVQVGGEVAQDSIGVFIALINECSKVGLRVEHEVPSSWTLIGRTAARSFRLAAPFTRVVGEPEFEADYRDAKPRWSMLFEWR